jgi:hypothetical protein
MISLCPMIGNKSRVLHYLSRNNNLNPPFMQFKFLLRKKIVMWLVTAPLVFCSCYTYRVTTQAQAGTEASKPVTAHSFFWGLVQKPTEIHTPVCDSLGVNGVSEVTVKTNLGYAFITVVTLGIWSPMKVQWKCSKPCKKSGEL